MILSKIRIKNFKSIEDITFNIKKFGDSYTRMLVGINESGKSNILAAMKFLKPPSEPYDYKDYSNLKNEENKPVELYFDLHLENKDIYLNRIKEITTSGGELLDMEIDDVQKRVYLEKGKRAICNFLDSY